MSTMRVEGKKTATIYHPPEPYYRELPAGFLRCARCGYAQVMDVVDGTISDNHGEGCDWLDHYRPR